MIPIIEFNGLRYRTDRMGLNNTTIEVEKDIPETIVKFYSNSENSLNAFMNDKLYLTHDSQFNDAFEASEHFFDFTLLEKEEYDRFYKEFLPPENYYPYEVDKNNNFSMFRMLCKYYFAWIGSVSFTTINNIFNSLMWSHYSTDKGFAIELGREELLNSIDNNEFGKWFFPINYVNDLRVINPIDASLGGMHGALLYLISTKSRDWKYEDEWRLTCYPKEVRFLVPETLLTPEMEGMERFLKYPRKCVKRVVLGHFFFNTKNIDCETYRSSNNHLRFKILKDSVSKDFINFIFENYNDILFMNDPYRHENNIVRAMESIKLEKESDCEFVIRPLGGVFADGTDS